MLFRSGTVPGATGRNLLAYSTEWDPALSLVDRRLVADPQTSGGLLFAVEPGHADALCAELEARGCLSARIGEMRAPEGQSLVVRA